MVVNNNIVFAPTVNPTSVVHIHKDGPHNVQRPPPVEFTHTPPPPPAPPKHEPKPPPPPSEPKKEESIQRPRHVSHTSSDGMSLASHATNRPETRRRSQSLSVLSEPLSEPGSVAGVPYHDHRRRNVTLTSHTVGVVNIPGEEKKVKKEPSSNISRRRSGEHPW